MPRGLLEEALDVRRRARMVCSAEAVDEALARMAAQLGAQAAGSDPLILAVMSGGVFTATALCGHFDFPYTFDYVHATRYGGALTGGTLEWRVAPAADVSGRDIVVVDDVIDHGVTLEALKRALDDRGAASVRLAVLVRKAVRTAHPRPRVDTVGIEAGDEYLFGCGMDYKGYWRGLPALYAVP